jgi:dTDP-4-amino-4,6-dideoxygalactose transaminase
VTALPVALPVAFPAPVYVSVPMLPPLEEFAADLQEIWASRLLTNLGPFHNRLEQALNERIGLGHLSLWNNGTTALLAGLAALDLHGEVIVTPMTFPATVHAIATLGLTPVFADIDETTLTLAPERVLEKLTDSTCAIVGTHLYGTFCDTAALGAIAHQHGLAVIYDGAHSFGRHRPIFPDGPDSLGDLTMLSFHATKLFHTVEGGAVITADPGTHERLGRMRNFGIRSEDVIDGVGLNGKMSEMHAALGMRVLPLLDDEIDRRGELAELYAKRLAPLQGLSVVAGTGSSAQYFVMRVQEDVFGSSRDELHHALTRLNIMSRRYFYPLCSNIAPYSSYVSAADLPIANRAASQCLALPFHGGLDDDMAERICDAIEWQARRGSGADG